MAAEKARLKLSNTIETLEQKRNSRIWLNIDGNHLCHPAMSAVLRERSTLRETNNLDILLHSPGGHPEIAYRMMRYFRRIVSGQVNVIVPLMAQSAATLMLISAY